MSEHIAKRPRMDGGSVNEVQRESTPPKKICDLGTQKFSEIVDMAAFVDKTLFIKAFLESGDSVIAILAPRKFGKSTNMDMLKEFLTGNKKLFEDNQLKIWKEERTFFNDYCVKNPVLHLDFKTVQVDTLEKLYGSCKEMICNAFNAHRYLVKKVGEKYCWSKEDMKDIKVLQKYWKGEPNNLSEFDVTFGLKKLCRYLYVYNDNKPVYVLLDECDAPILKAIKDTRFLEGTVVSETMRLIRALVSSLFRDNQYMKKGLINARIRIASVSLSDANNIRYYKFLEEHKFLPYFGFTDKEVKSLFERDEFVNLKNGDIQKWYNGYRLRPINEYVIYNSYSILSYLQNSKRINKPQFASYWADSGNIDKLNELFAITRIRRRIEDIINGEEVIIRTVSEYSEREISTIQCLMHDNVTVVYCSVVNLFLQFLVDNGYLNVVYTWEGKRTLVAPNNEIKNLLKQKCYDAKMLQNKYQLSPENIRNYVIALESLLQERDRNAFIRFAKAVSELFNGALMPESEYEFHSILFTLAYDNKPFSVRSELSVERSKEKGRLPHLDIFVILSNVAMILELKFEYKSSVEAHTQILTQEYAAAFNDHMNVTAKILLGVHMTKERKVSLTYTVDNSARETVTSDDQTM